MSTLRFTRARYLLELFDKNHALVASFQAANNVDSSSRGPWPDGVFKFETWYAHQEDAEDPDSSYGCHGIFIFNVADREGMGVHSGRVSEADGLGRLGPEHCTMGCIRTTDDATLMIHDIHFNDPLLEIVVE